MATNEFFISDGPSADRVWDAAKYAGETPGLSVRFTVTKSNGTDEQTLTPHITGVMRDNSIGTLLIISGHIGTSTFTGRYHTVSREGILHITEVAADSKSEELLPA